MLYRGFLLAWFAALLGTWPALGLSSLAFGAGHAYQGGQGVLRTGGLGLVLAGLFWLTGSLLPPILLHAVVDLNSGWLGRRVLTRPAPEPPIPA
jgi:membrane protease YdiL (CAAX protease family)